MLHSNDLTYRIGERLLIDHASVAIPIGARVGSVEQEAPGGADWNRWVGYVTGVL